MIEPHAHFPIRYLTIETYDPDRAGVRCGICDIQLDFKEGEFREWMVWYVFGRFTKYPGLDNRSGCTDSETTDA